MGRPIPEIRARLHELAAIYKIPELTELAEATRRNRPIRKGTPVRGSLTPELAVRIRAYAKTVPTMTMREIGTEFNVDQGRVSEALNRTRGM